MGLYSSAKKYVGWPITPGFDFAGHICAVGRTVNQRQVGDPVVGVTRFGGYASHVCVPVTQVFPLPEGWTMVRAAAFPTVHLTAWYALCELSRPRPGKKVLVHSGAGGVGTAALAICRHLGLDALAVVGASHKIDTARRSGAADVVDRSSESLWERAELFAPEGFDIILEASGASTLRQSYRHLGPTGRLLIYGMATLLSRGDKRINWFRVAWQYLRLPWFHPMSLLDRNVSVSGFNLSYLFTQQRLLNEAMLLLLDWACAGVLIEPPIREYPLDDVASAHRDLESGNTVGKLVLIP